MASLEALIYQHLVRPVLFHTDAEAAHGLVLAGLQGLQALPSSLGAVERHLTVIDQRLVTEWKGMCFRGPLGVAAGLDKTGSTALALKALGPSFIEVGGVTLHPQVGNERPRLFRLPEDAGIVNRMGFNGLGAEATATILAGHGPIGVPIFVNVALNKNIDMKDDRAIVDNWFTTIRALYGVANAFVVNVSSPNTPGLRALQDPERLRFLFPQLTERLAEMCRSGPPKPVLIKFAADLTDEDIAGLVGIWDKLRCTSVPTGLVLVNTMVGRPDGLRSAHASEKGGLSGQSITRRAQEIAVKFREALPDVFMIGVGGIASAEQAIARLEVCDLVQLYTGMVYEGPAVFRDLNRGILTELKRRGLTNVSQLRRRAA